MRKAQGCSVPLDGGRYSSFANSLIIKIDMGLGRDKLLCIKQVTNKDPLWASLLPQMVKKSTCNTRDLGSIPVLERSPEEEHVNPLQYSCLENPVDCGA